MRCAQHPDVADVAVVGVPSAEWGETPVAFVVSRGADGEELRTFANERLGKTQRIARWSWWTNCRAAISAKC